MLQTLHLCSLKVLLHIFYAISNIFSDLLKINYLVLKSEHGIHGIMEIMPINQKQTSYANFINSVLK